MRVIAGTARRLQLKTLDGIDTRPTTDRIKETLFNMISAELYDSNFLDLFSGSGGIGIEALSRGAANAVFVEKNPKAMKCIQENLESTKLKDRAKTMQMDVFAALSRLNGEWKFEYIFMDPPYNHEWEKQVCWNFSLIRLCWRMTELLLWKHRRRQICLMQKNWAIP